MIVKDCKIYGNMRVRIRKQSWYIRSVFLHLEENTLILTCLNYNGVPTIGRFKVA